MKKPKILKNINPNDVIEGKEGRFHDTLLGNGWIVQFFKNTQIE